MKPRYRISSLVGANVATGGARVRPLIVVDRADVRLLVERERKREELLSIQ